MTEESSNYFHKQGIMEECNPTLIYNAILNIVARFRSFMKLGS